jgi:hypothetical protein
MRSDAVLASLAAMHGWTAGPPLRGKQRISRTFRVVALARSAWSAVRGQNTGLVLPIRVSVEEFLAIMCGRPGCGLRSNP